MVAIKLHNLLVDKCDGKCGHEKFCKELPKYGKNLKEFGELGTVQRYDKSIKRKLENRGRICMFVGYAENHSSNVFRMYNLGMRGVKMT